MYVLIAFILFICLIIILSFKLYWLFFVGLARSLISFLGLKVSLFCLVTLLVTEFGGSHGIEHFVHPIYSEFGKKYSLSYQQKAAMSFKLKDFIAAPSQELLNLAKNSDLLDVKTSILKREIKNFIIQFLVDEDFLNPKLHLILYSHKPTYS